jgi:hypothetical protein
MSNESENRIDLTRFKGLTKGEWVYEEVVKGTGWVATLMIPHTGADTPEHPHGLPYPVASVTEHDYHLTRSDIKAMASVPDLIAELKRCYDLIDVMQGNVPYVEHCEDCGATDGGEAEGCDYCGIIHYQSKKRGFYHKDSQKTSE